MGIATLYQRVIYRLASRAGFAGRRSHKSRNPRRIYLGGLVLLIGAAALGTAILALQPAPANAQSIPTNASGGCPVPAATFNSWFQSGTPALNGVVSGGQPGLLAHQPVLLLSVVRADVPVAALSCAFELRRRRTHFRFADLL